LKAATTDKEITKMPLEDFSFWCTGILKCVGVKINIPCYFSFNILPELYGCLW